MNVTQNVDLDSGSNATYDVIPDLRFLANYIQFNIAAAYSDLNVKGHPMVSPLSLAAYCMLLINAHLLGCDSYYRPTKSHWCKSFLNDQSRIDYFDVLLNCEVPTFLADIISQLAPVYDARRTNHIFVPSLAGYSHSHDFGRLLPPHIWLHAHHLLATVNSRTDPDTYQAIIYDTLITTYGTQTFHIGNFFGTHIGTEHPNWVNQDFEGFFNPLVGRTLTQKPTFSKLHIHPQSYTDYAHFPIYEYFLLADDDNCDTMSSFAGSISACLKAQTKGSTKLGVILASLSGPLIFSHSLEPVTLPTWSGKKIVPAKKDKAALQTPVSDKKFAEDNHFMVAATDHIGDITYPTADALKFMYKSLYRLLKVKFDPASRPNPRVLFDTKTHVTPYVMYFQPYDVNSSSLAHTIICGIKIELAEIDGFTIPSEHPESSLDDNNSQFLQSAVRISDILPVLSHSDPATSHLQVLARRQVDRTDQAIGLAFRDMSINVLPYFANENVDTTAVTTEADTGFTREENHDTPHSAYTYTAGTNGTLPLGPKTKVFAWSSYRVITKNGLPTLNDVKMVLSLRPVYGTNVTLSRSKNPALIIPH
jgi:hypothetical protein